MVNDDEGRDRRGVSRRRFVKAAGASGVAAGLAGCVTQTGDGGDGGDGGDTETGDGGDGTSGTGTTAGTSDGGGGSAEETTIQFASDSDHAEIQDQFNQWLHEAGMPQNITVEILAGSNVTDQRQQKYGQWLNAGRANPSILMMDSGWTIPFIAREQLLNLSEEMSDTVQTVRDTYFEASVNTALGDGGDMYAVPMYPDFPTMLYRKDLVTEAGYDPEGNNWATESMSWQRFSEITKDTMEQTDTDMGYTFQFDVYEGLSCCDFNEFLSSYGGAYFGPLDNLFGPVGDRPITVDEQPVVDSLRMLRTFINGSDDQYALDGVTGGISPEAVLQWVEDTSLKPFSNGNAVMHRNWPYAINQTGAEDAFGEDLGVMPIPYGVEPSNAQYEGTGGPVAALGGWHAAINPNTNKLDAAKEVVRALTNEQVQLNLFQEIGWIPPRRELLGSDQASQVPVMGRYLEQLQVAGENAIPRPVTVVWPQESSQIAQKANQAVSGNQDPAEMMSQLKSALQEIEQSA